MENGYLISACIVLVILVAYLVITKLGIVKDEDNDFIPDEVEAKVEDIKDAVNSVKKEVNHRVERINEELTDVKETAVELTKQIKDVGAAAKGSNRKGRKPATKKTNQK